MSNMIITDYMAGQIGDEYYEHQCNEAAGLVIEIDDTDNGNRYHLDRGGAKNCSSWPALSNFDHFEREVPDEASDPDAGMDKITDITQVRAGDTEVTKSGNRYKVIKNDSISSTLKLKAAIPESNDENTWLHDSAFAYALRPKPEVPNAPGLYRDKDGGVWELIEGRGCWRLHNGAGFICPTRQDKGALDQEFAPYSRIDLERES